MLQVKAPYYPHLQVTSVETRFGAVETNRPNLYDSPLNGKTIVRIDTLDILKDVWGESILMSRDKTYKLVSGSTTDEEYRKLLSSYYAKYASFCNYVTEKYIFGDESVPLIRRLIEPVRSMLDTHAMEVISLMRAKGGKFLMHTHDYIYFAFKTSDVPEVRGSIIIC